MAIYECVHCRKFAKIGPGECWNCGKPLTPKAFPPDPPGGGGHNPGPPPPPGNALYRCKTRRHFASFTSGNCLLCGGPTQAEPITGNVQSLKEISDAIQRIADEMKQMQTGISDLIRQASSTLGSVSYNLTPSWLYSRLVGTPVPNMLARLRELLRQSIALANQLRELKGKLQRQGLTGNVHTLSTMGVRPIADTLSDVIDHLLGQCLQQQEQLEKVIAKLQ